MLRGVHPSAKTATQELRSYNRGQEFATNDLLLWQPNQLSTEDKHLLPHIIPFVTVSLYTYRTVPRTACMIPREALGKEGR